MNSNFPRRDALDLEPPARCFAARRNKLTLYVTTVFLFFFALLSAYPQADEDTARGNRAMAERYALWVKNAINEGLWSEALAGLERAYDFADVSSDICYLLALARSHQNKARTAVLEALSLALEVDHWVIFKPEEARLFKIETMIALRAYPEAFNELSLVGKGPMEATLTLKALAASRPLEFRSFAKEAMDRHPRECAIVRVILDFLKEEDTLGINPEREDLELLDLVMRRLPLLIQEDAELAWMAAPFMRDAEEAKRFVMAYRAVHKPALESLPVALRLGVIGEETALEELFSVNARLLYPSTSSSENSIGGQVSWLGKNNRSLDVVLLGQVWSLLRRDEARAIFRRNLSAYTGVLTEDADGDGIPETYSEYFMGILGKSTYDTTQSGIPELTIYFEGGVPERALALLPPESSEIGFSNRKEAAIKWERYPAVLEVEMDGAVFIPRPLDHYYTPVLFVELWGSALIFPQRDPLRAPLTRRVLVSQSLRVERPSLEFSGGREIVELNQGIPVRAREYVGDLMVSQTEFLRGRPQLQQVDLDFDGHMDTARHFRRNYREMELEDLWDYDRDFDYAESIMD